MDIDNEIKSAYSAYRRGGDYLVKIFTKPEKKITGDECLYLHNTYGINIKNIILMCISHGFQVEYTDFSKLLKIQYEDLKKSKLCLQKEKL